MVDVADFLEQVEAIRMEAPAYQLGHDGSDGGCDCIGLIIGAIRRAGGEWNGSHGSNYAARNRMVDLYAGLGARELEHGWLVFKAKAPGDAGYDLPAKYKEGGQASNGDWLDYYHVGVVTGVNPLRITHCTSSGSVNGITVDTRMGKWGYAGPCYLIDYGGEGGVTMQKATVRASSGSTVNLRRRPSAYSDLITRIPVGDTVTILSTDGEWCHVGAGNQTGYMMAKFLDTGSATGETAAEGGAEQVDGAKLLADLKTLLQKYESQGERL